MDGDILLGPEEIEQERVRASKAFYQAWLLNCHLSWGDYWEKWELRAQVAKVCKWIETDPKAVIGTRALQALRATAGTHSASGGPKEAPDA